MNFSFIHKQMDNFFITESRVHLPDNVINSNLTCVASYPSVSGSLRQKSILHIPTNYKGEHKGNFMLKGIDNRSVTSTFTVHLESIHTP